MTDTNKIQLIKIDQLLAIVTDCPSQRLIDLLPYLNEVMVKYDITSKARIAHFIAQTAHESDGFNTNEEYATGSDYEGRGDLGNTQTGDGVRFKGRGLIQVTGRTNYFECGRALNVDLIANPEKLSTNEYAALSAGWFWDKNNLNKIADDMSLSSDETCTQITKIVNGGYNGLDARLGYLNRAMSVL